ELAQQRDERLVAVRVRGVKRGRSLQARAVRIRTCFEQEPAELYAAEVRGGGERPHPRDRAGRDRPRIPAPLHPGPPRRTPSTRRAPDRAPHGVLATAKAREIRWAESAGRDLVDPPRFVVEELAQPLDAAEQRGLAGVELLVGRNELRSALALSAVERMRRS